MTDSTILYYTSNKEKPEFEERIRQNLLSVCGDLPIISISHKPIDLGKNICVGDVGASGFNMFRQVLLGCEAATTEFVVSAEADCLYPPDYFTFIPPKNDVCYWDSNLYVMGHRRNYFFKKEGGATHAQVIGREFYIELLRKLFEGAPQWCVEEKNFPKERRHKENVFDYIEHYQTENPVVQIKTGDSMRHYTVSERIPILEIPYWGAGKEIYKKYLI
jgi:hypothetical protein